MKFNDKVFKQINEAKYLSTENTWRYRSILRLFYIHHEKIKYFLQIEEIYEALKQNENFNEYTKELLKQDLDVLISWGNLSAVQDTAKARTLEEFNNKKFRYKLSDFSVEIERMLIKLETMHIEGASLEPSLLEKIKEKLKESHDIIDDDIDTIGTWWKELNSLFKTLNENYQDYMRQFYGAKADELMKASSFLTYKDKFIEHLRKFIKSLQNQSQIIQIEINKINESDKKILFGKILEYEKSIPRLDKIEIEDIEIKTNIMDKWDNLIKWFISKNNEISEAERLLEVTNEIIRKITRCAVQILENKNSAANRKEEYRKLSTLFLKTKDIKEAHILSSLIFGIENTNHYKSNMIRKTENINSTIYEEEPEEITLKPRIRTYRIKSERSPIKSYKENKEEIIRKTLEKRKKDRELLEKYIQNEIIDFSTINNIEITVRNTLLRWIGKALNNNNRCKIDTGHTIKIINPKTNEKCEIKSTDGSLQMPAFKVLVTKK